jgi:hypothetical protein
MNTPSYELTLRESIGPVYLGASRSDVLLAIGEPDSSTEDEIDGIEEFYDDEGFRVSYARATDRCNNVALFSPSQLTYIALRIHVRTLLKSGINTISEAVEFIPSLLHPILKHKPPILDLVQIWGIGR